MMTCPQHSRAEVVGYCTVCGDLGCEECVREHEGSWYCLRHYQPIQERLDRQKKLEASAQRVERQRLVVRTREGRTYRGTCLALNTLASSFVLELVDEEGYPLHKTHTCYFHDLKAVFYVKSFSGAQGQNHSVETPATVGIPMVVEFSDGEVMQGFTTQRIHPGLNRFYLIPKDGNSNNVSVLVEMSAVAGVYTPEEYRDKHRHELEAYFESNRKSGLSKEEIFGNFHFERHDYSRAIKHYREALKEDPESSRLRKKIVSSEYNIGMRHIKAHQYDQALKCMEWVLNADPKNEHAKEKARKLRAHLARGTRKHMTPAGSDAQ